MSRKRASRSFSFSSSSTYRTNCNLSRRASTVSPLELVEGLPRNPEPGPSRFASCSKPGRTRRSGRNRSQDELPRTPRPTALLAAGHRTPPRACRRPRGLRRRDLDPRGPGLAAARMLYAALGGYASNTGVETVVTPFTALQAAAVYACIRADLAGHRHADAVRPPPPDRRRLPARATAPAEQACFAVRTAGRTWFEFIGFAVTSICLRGNAFVVVERDRDANPIELVPIASGPRDHHADRRRRALVSDQFPTPRLWQVVPPDDMIHIKEHFDGRLRRSVADRGRAGRSIGLALATQQHGGTLFRQGEHDRWRDQSPRPTLEGSLRPRRRTPGARRTRACKTRTRSRSWKKA